MSGSGLARHVGWNLGWAGLGARVAGAHLAVTRIDGGDASAGLVPGVVPRRTLEFVLAPPSHHGVGWFNITGSGNLEPSVHRSAGSEAFLGPASDGRGFEPGEGYGYETEISSG